MDLSININLDNAAFRGDDYRLNVDAVQSLLSDITDTFVMHYNDDYLAMRKSIAWNVQDVNGNTIGQAKITL